MKFTGRENLKVRNLPIAKTEYVRQSDIKELNRLLNNEGVYGSSDMIKDAYVNLGFDTCKKRIKGIGKYIGHHYFSWEYLAIIKPDMKEKRIKWKEKISQFKKS